MDTSGSDSDSDKSRSQVQQGSIRGPGGQPTQQREQQAKVQVPEPVAQSSPAIQPQTTQPPPPMQPEPTVDQPPSAKAPVGASPPSAKASVGARPQDQTQVAQPTTARPQEPPKQPPPMQSPITPSAPPVARPAMPATPIGGQAGRPAGAKEEEFVGSKGDEESVPVVEMREPKELPTEVEGWLERVERDDVAEPPTIVHQGKPVVSSAAPQQGSVTLPLDDGGIKKGLHHKLADSVRWLAEWCVRLVKKFGGKGNR